MHDHEDPPVGSGTAALIWGMMTLAVVTVAWAIGTAIYAIQTIIGNHFHG